jgi:hypothetical protein
MHTSMSLPASCLSHSGGGGCEAQQQRQSLSHFADCNKHETILQVTLLPRGSLSHFRIAQMKKNLLGGTLDTFQTDFTSVYDAFLSFRVVDQESLSHQTHQCHHSGGCRGAPVSSSSSSSLSIAPHFLRVTYLNS